MTKKEKRESELLQELQADHGYMLFKMKRRAERTGTRFKRVGNKLKYEPAIIVQLAVPARSAVGKAFAELYVEKRR